MKSESEMLRTLATYCSQAERCLFDVRKKIQAENFTKEAEQRLINKLLFENFIDEKRYSRSFVHDKFKLNHWGRIKISYELKVRGIPQDIYRETINTTIDEDEYLAVLSDLLIAKKRTVKGRSPQEIYQKLYRFATAKGFESTCTVKILKKMFKNIDDD